MRCGWRQVNGVVLTRWRKLKGALGEIRVDLRQSASHPFRVFPLAPYTLPLTPFVRVHLLVLSPVEGRPILSSLVPSSPCLPVSVLALGRVEGSPCRRALRSPASRESQVVNAIPLTPSRSRA
jgi:hypothetical protein